MQAVEGITNTFAVIRSLLKNHGVDLSPEGEAFVGSELTGHIAIGDGKAFIATPTELEPVQDLEAHLLGLLNQQSTRRYFVASKLPTTAHSGQSEPNPFTIKNRNITRQMMIEQQDPALARRLREEAAKVDAKLNDGGDPSNPFSKAGWNLTAQMKLIKSNPEHARQLEANANA